MHFHGEVLHCPGDWNLPLIVNYVDVWFTCFYLIRRDLALETFRNKFSYLNHSIITSKYKFSY